MSLKKSGLTIVVSLWLLIISPHVHGFEITQPKPGEVFRPGDKVVVQVKTEKRLAGVMFYTVNSRESDIDLIPPFSFQFTIPAAFSGKETVVADGKLQDGSHIHASVQITVVLPTSITLRELKTDRNKLYLTKMPEGTPGAHFYEQRQLRINGVFSDGVLRDLSSSTSGTVYSSSNGRVATVDSNGLVTAMSPGAAKIIAKNRSKQIEIAVAVKAKK